MPQSTATPSSSVESRCSLGLVTYCFNIAMAAAAKGEHQPNLGQPLEFLKNAREIGASGAQVALGKVTAEEARAVRAYAEREGMFLEGTLALPKAEQDDFDRFVAELQRSKECGARIVRTVMLPGRRYEQFPTFRDYQKAMREGVAALQRAEAVARHEGVRIAVENHKDQRTEERLAIFQGISSEFIGACLDVGNNLALLEDPLETAKAFAPWVISVHFKDQGLADYDEGFLLADVPLGRGSIELKPVIELLAKEAPRARLFLELITRDPLKVPVLTEQYWETLDDIAAPDMAAIWGRVKEAGRSEFPLVSKLTPEEQLKVERDNIKNSLAYAIRELNLKA